MLAGQDRAAATARARRAWGDGAMLDQGGVDDPAIWAVTAALAGSEAWDELGVVLDTVADAASRAGAVLAHATAGYVRAYRWLALGEIGDALAEIDRTLAARAVGWGTFVPGAIWVRVRCLLEQGDLAAAEATLEDRVRRRGGALPRLAARAGAARRPGGRGVRAQRQRRGARDVARGGRARRRRRESTTRRSSRGGRAPPSPPPASASSTRRSGSPTRRSPRRAPWTCRGRWASG